MQENNEEALEYTPAPFPASLSAAVCLSAGSLCLSAGSLCLAAAAVCLSAGSLCLSAGSLCLAAAAVCLSAAAVCLAAGQAAAAHRWWHGSHLFLSGWPSRWPCLGNGLQITE